MAKPIQLKHKNSGVMKTGYYGFSWTTLFFGGFPALFRGDFLTFIGSFVVLFLLGLAIHPFVIPIAMFIWAFFYNGYYTRKLLEKGYEFSDFSHINEMAASVLSVSAPTAKENGLEKNQTFQNDFQSNVKFSSEEKVLSNDAYKIYLVKKYPIEYNEVLKKHIVKDKLYETVDDALIALHEVENATVANQSVKIKYAYTNKSEAVAFLRMIGAEVQELDNSKFTVAHNKSVEYFYSEADLLKYASKEALNVKSN